MVRSSAPANGENRSRHRALLALSLAVAGWAVYINSLTNPFVYDDYRLIVENGALAHPTDLWGVLWHDITRPVVNLSYALDAAIWGLRPLGYHVTNVLLHAINVLLVFAFARAMDADARTPRVDTNSSGAAPLASAGPCALAILTAALFAVHPMMSQAVGYISARADLLCATFVLTAFLAARRYLLTARPGWAVAAIAAWLLALGSKEVAAMLPFVLVSYQMFVRPAAVARRTARSLYVPMFGLVAVAIGVRIWLLRQVEYQSGSLDWPLAIVAVDAVERYLRLLLWPSGQTVFHALTAMDTLFDARTFLAFGIIAGVAAVAWWLRRIDRIIPFGLAWFVLFLLPSSALFVLGRGEALAEHRAYLSSAGVFLAGGALFAAALRRSRADAPALRWVVVAFATVIVLQLGARTMLRNAVWSNPIGLWQESVNQAPDHWLPHLMLAEALRVQRGCEVAVPEYRTAIRQRPQETFAYTKMGGCLIDLRRLDEASAVFQGLVRIAPTSADGSTGLAIVAMMQGHPEQSREYLVDALRRDRSAIVPRQLLASLEEPGDPATARRLCLEIKQLAPQTPGADDCIRRNEQRLGSPDKNH